MSRTRRRLALFTAAIAAGTVSALAAGSAFAAVDWTETATPDIGAGYGFEAIEVLSDTDAWAVGVADTEDGTVAAHWDGTAWTHTKTPAAWDLLDVAGSAGDDVWAVGRGQSGANLIRWDGGAWSSVDSPDPGLPDGQTPGLYAVAAHESGKAWAGGCGDSDSASTGYAQHWDGSKWMNSELPIPDGAGNSCVFGFEYVADDEVWAFGTTWDKKAWILRWDGTAWKRQTTPEHTESVTMSGSYRGDDGRLCAGGYTLDADLKPSPYLLCRDDGTWTEIATPDIDAFAGALGPDGAGGMFLTGSGDGDKPVLLRFDGETVVEETPPASATGGLTGVDSAPGSSRVWVAGTAGSKGLAAHTG